MRLFAVTVLLLLGADSMALEPREIAILVNKKEPRSKELAEYYAKKRRVPTTNIIELDVPPGEDVVRSDYNEKIVKPLRRELADRRKQIKVLLCMYGMPLRVGRLPMTELEQQESGEVHKELVTLHDEVRRENDVIKDLEESFKKTEFQGTKETIEKRRQDLQPKLTKIALLEAKDRKLQHFETEAAVDSELMLLWWNDYPLEQWVVNPLCFRTPPTDPNRRQQTLMTCRLDGPSSPVVRQMIDDSIETEEKGLDGVVYVDARGIKWDPAADQSGTGYGGYDESLREMATLFEQLGKMTVRSEDTEALFAPDTCPDCALYCGWYSVNNYIPSFKFRRGAVAYHMASFEAVSLRNPQRRWCGNLLNAGVVATLGPVAEPYLVAFPKPAEFFGFLATGEYTLVEAYAHTELFASWMMTLVGDPLYNPFKKTPRLKIRDVKPSPNPVRPNAVNEKK